MASYDTLPDLPINPAAHIAEPDAAVRTAAEQVRDLNRQIDLMQRTNPANTVGLAALIAARTTAEGAYTTAVTAQQAAITALNRGGGVNPDLQQIAETPSIELERQRYQLGGYWGMIGRLNQTERNLYTAISDELERRRAIGTPNSTSVISRAGQSLGTLGRPRTWAHTPSSEAYRYDTQRRHVAELARLQADITTYSGQVQVINTEIARLQRLPRTAGNIVAIENQQAMRTPIEATLARVVQEHREERDLTVEQLITKERKYQTIQRWRNGTFTERLLATPAATTDWLRTNVFERYRNFSMLQKIGIGFGLTAAALAAPIIGGAAGLGVGLLVSGARGIVRGITAANSFIATEAIYNRDSERALAAENLRDGTARTLGTGTKLWNVAKASAWAAAGFFAAPYIGQFFNYALHETGIANNAMDLLRSGAHHVSNGARIIGGSVANGIDDVYHNLTGNPLGLHAAYGAGWNPGAAATNIAPPGVGAGALTPAAATSVPTAGSTSMPSTVTSTAPSLAPVPSPTASTAASGLSTEAAQAAEQARLAGEDLVRRAQMSANELYNDAQRGARNLWEQTFGHPVGTGHATAGAATGSTGDADFLRDIEAEKRNIGAGVGRAAGRAASSAASLVPDHGPLGNLDQYQPGATGRPSDFPLHMETPAGETATIPNVQDVTPRASSGAVKRGLDALGLGGDAASPNAPGERGFGPSGPLKNFFKPEVDTSLKMDPNLDTTPSPAAPLQPGLNSPSINHIDGQRALGPFYSNVPHIEGERALGPFYSRVPHIEGERALGPFYSNTPPVEEPHVFGTRAEDYNSLRNAPFEQPHVFGTRPEDYNSLADAPFSTPEHPTFSASDLTVTLMEKNSPWSNDWEIAKNTLSKVMGEKFTSLSEKAQNNVIATIVAPVEKDPTAFGFTKDLTRVPDGTRIPAWQMIGDLAADGKTVKIDWDHLNELTSNAGKRWPRGIFNGAAAAATETVKATAGAAVEAISAADQVKVNEIGDFFHKIGNPRLTPDLRPAFEEARKLAGEMDTPADIARAHKAVEDLKQFFQKPGGAPSVIPSL